MDHYYTASSSSSAPAMNKYWIPHKDIHKKVIMTQIQYYLGPEATARSYTKDGEDGFLITTPGECLTDEQIDDICLKSIEMWERQAASRSTDTGSTKQLKRPLHQPVVIAKGGGSRSGYTSSNDGRSRRPAHRSSHHHSNSSTNNHHHHNHHHNNGSSHHGSSSHQRSYSNTGYQSPHTRWEPMSPAKDNMTPDRNMQYQMDEGY